MPQTKDYYDILGIDEDADAREIKKAYRDLARKHHPDRNPDDSGAEDRFKEIQEAYSVLSDKEKRQQYDQRRRFGGFNGGGSPFGGGGFDGGGSPFGGNVRFEQGAGGGMGDIFEQFFGGGQRGGRPGSDPFQQARQQQQQQRRQQQRQRGQDVETRLRLSFQEALNGGRKQVKLPSGESIRLSIPQGVKDGYKVRLRGKGQAGPRGQRGDLYVKFDVADHPRFRRTGDDIYLTESISAFDAMLGTTRRIPTPYGQHVKLTIPAGTQPGEKLRLKKQGVKTEDGATGDLYVEVDVTIPDDLTEAQREGLRDAMNEIGLS